MGRPKETIEQNKAMGGILIAIAQNKWIACDIGHFLGRATKTILNQILLLEKAGIVIGDSVPQGRVGGPLKDYVINRTFFTYQYLNTPTELYFEKPEIRNRVKKEFPEYETCINRYPYVFAHYLFLCADWNYSGFLKFLSQQKPCKKSIMELMLVFGIAEMKKNPATNKKIFSAIERQFAQLLQEKVVKIIEGGEFLPVP